MASIYPNYSEGFPRVGHSPALDALQQLGSASPASGMVPNPHRLTETPDPILDQLKMAYPGNRTGGPIKNMAPERREKPSAPALEG